MADRKDEDKGINDEALDGIVSGEGTSRQETDFGPQIVAEDPNSAGQASDDEIYDAEIIEEEYDEDAEIDNFEIGDNPGTGTYGPEVAPEEEEEQIEETPEEPAKKEKKKIGVKGGILIGAGIACVILASVGGGVVGSGVLSNASQVAVVIESQWEMSYEQERFMNSFIEGLGVSAKVTDTKIKGLVPVMNAKAEYSIELCADVKTQSGARFVTIELNDETFGDVKDVKTLTIKLRDADRNDIGDVKTYKKLDMSDAVGKNFKKSFQESCLNVDGNENFIDDIFLCTTVKGSVGIIDVLGVSYDEKGDIKEFFYKEAVLTLTDKVNGVKSEDVMSAFRREFGAKEMSYSGRVDTNLDSNLDLSSYGEAKKDEIVSEVKKAISSDKKFDGWDITL